MIINQNKNIEKIEIVDPSIVEKVVDTISENRDAGVIIASYIGTSIIIYMLGKSIAEIIRAFRDSGK